MMLSVRHTTLMQIGKDMWISRITNMSDRNFHHVHKTTNGDRHFQNDGGHLIKIFSLQRPLLTHTVPNDSGSSRYWEPGKLKPFLLVCLNMALLFEKDDTASHRNWSIWLSITDFGQVKTFWWMLPRRNMGTKRQFKGSCERNSDWKERGKEGHRAWAKP